MQNARSLNLGTTFKWMLLAGVVSTLAACGGGDDPAPAITISGTAATGAAIANGSVSVACKVGSGSATTAADGAFTVKVAAPGEGPCVISVTTGSTTLRSIAAGDGAKANVTPLTEMLVSYIAVQSGAGASATPAALAANANFNTVLKSPTVLAATVQQLVAVIKAAAGADVIVPTDFLTATLVPKSSTNAGNAQDQILELLRARAVITSTGAVSASVTAAVASNAAAHSVTGATGGI